jgi:hypothetical protein
MRAAHSWRRWWPAVTAAVVLYGLWALTLASSDEPVRVVAAPQAAFIAPAAPAAIVAPTPEPGPPAAVVAAAAEASVPPGVSSEQWASIESELMRRPDAAAELQRLRGYLEWSDALRRFRDGRAAGATTPEQLALAREIEQGLGERVRRGEVSAAEARQIESAILALFVPDEAERGERLRQWATAELAPPAPADPRQEAFERRQAEIVAAWGAQPAAARDPAALERDLEALRRQSFAAPGGGPR